MRVHHLAYRFQVLALAAGGEEVSTAEMRGMRWWRVRIDRLINKGIYEGETK